MLLGLEGVESHAIPYLVLRLIHENGGLVAASDCITWPFFLPVWEKLYRLNSNVNPPYETQHHKSDRAGGSEA